jgi:hypothetical protein
MKIPKHVMDILGPTVIGYHDGAHIHARAYVTRRELEAVKKRAVESMFDVVWHGEGETASPRVLAEWWRAGTLAYDGGTIEVWCVSAMAGVYLGAMRTTLERAVNELPPGSVRELAWHGAAPLFDATKTEEGGS